MTKTARTPVWLPPISFLAGVLIIGLISFAWQLSPLSVTGQALLLLIALRGFCYWPPMRRWVSSMPVPHRIVFALMIAGIILGHYTLKARQYFPYVAWEIFPARREEDPVKCPAFIATTAAGKKVRLLAEQLFPSIVQIDPIDTDPRQMARVDHLAFTLIKSYNELHSDDPVRGVDLVLVSVKLHPATGEPPSSSEVLKHYDAASN